MSGAGWDRISKDIAFLKIAVANRYIQKSKRTSYHSIPTGAIVLSQEVSVYLERFTHYQDSCDNFFIQDWHSL